MRLVSLSVLVALAVAGCHRAAPDDAHRSLDALDDKLTANAPAVTEPLPRSAASASTSKPAPMSHPVAPASAASVRDCLPTLDHSLRWAGRLPAGITLYPGAHLSEAAGSAADGCALRVVSFATDAPLATVAGWYATHLRAAGYRPAQRGTSNGTTLTGDSPTRAVVLYLSPRRGGTDVDLIATTTR